MLIKEQKAMKEFSALRTLSGLMTVAVLTVVLVACGKEKQETSSTTSTMVVVFASGDVKVVRSAKEVPATVGLLVNQDDTIKTTNGTVDLQTRTGSAVRIKEFTTITISKLVSNNTKLSMKNGSILATVKKADAKEEFNVVTPTAIAGVRGTTFSVDVVNGKNPRVRVIEGKVAMAPRIEALENYSEEEVQKSPTLQKLSEMQQSHEIILEEESVGTIPTAVEESVIVANNAIEKAQAEKQNVEEVKAISSAVEKYEQAVKKDDEAVEIVNKKVTIAEKAEADTLVLVDDKIIEQISSEKAGTEALKPSEEIVKAISEERNKKQEIVLQKIEEEASKKKLTSNKEIQNFYEKLEKVILKDGRTITGAVIAQTGDKLVIHSSEGVQRIEKKQIEAQEFLY
jgi:hypothetical protein